MDAVKYVKTQFRLCRSKDSCSECPLQDKENCCCITDTIEYVEKAVQIVEEWAKDNPEKTRQSEFLKIFQDAKIGKDGVLTIYPCAVEKRLSCTKCGGMFCDDCRKEYWLKRVDD